jgi:hypothetical protein
MKTSGVDNNTEEIRLIIISIILATSFGFFTINHSDIFSTNILRFTLVLSSILGFIYVLLTATYYKYDNRQQLGDYVIPTWLRSRTFDYCIDVFGINLYIFTLLSLNHFFYLHTHLSRDLRWGLSVIITFIILSLFVINGIYLKYFKPHRKEVKKVK